MEKTYNLVTANLLLADINSNGTPTKFLLGSSTYAKFCIEFKDYYKETCGHATKTRHCKTPVCFELGVMFGAPVIKDESLEKNILKVIW